MRLGTYEEWQRARTSTPRALLAQLVRGATGAGIDRVDRVFEGYSNEVYRVGCSNGADVVIRILRFDDDVSMSRSVDEASAIRRARSAGVLTGEVLLLDSIQVDGIDYPAMVQQAVPGRPLCDVIGDFSKTQRYAVLEEVGRFIGRLGSVAIDTSSSWTADAAATLAALRGEHSLLLDIGFTVTQVRAVLERLDGYLAELSGHRVVLSHGDLSTKHIFVVDSHPAVGAQVSGFIDFGDWAPAPPLHDLAVLRVRSPELELRPLLDGFGAIRSEDGRRNLDLHTLFIALDAFTFQVAELDDASAAVTANLIRTLVADLTPPAIETSR